MSIDEALRLRAEVENEIEHYLAQCRQGATTFINKHFSLAPVAAAHAETARSDVLRHPVNLALALPSLVLKRAAGIAEKMAWPRAQALLERVPLPMKTEYEKRIDAHLLREVFDVRGFHQALLRNRTVARGIADGHEFLRSDEWITTELQKVTREWSASRAQLIDAAGSGAVLAASYLVFRSSGHSVLEMGRKMAGDNARAHAVDTFVLGKQIGGLFYSIAPVHPTTGQVILATAIMFAFIGLLTVVVNLLSDPIQRQFGMQHKLLTQTIDTLEERLLLALKKRLKGPSGPVLTPIAMPTVERMAMLSGQALDVASIAAGYAKQGTVKALAQVLAAVTVARRRFVERVGERNARLAAAAAGLLMLVVMIVAWQKTHVSPYAESETLIEDGAYTTAIARLDWLNRHPAYREQAYYWFLRGRAYCGMRSADQCTDAYARALQKDTSYREDEHLQEDVTRLVCEHNHARAKKLVLQELGPEVIPQLKQGLPAATDRFELAALLEQLGARPDYEEVVKRTLEEASSCDDKRRVIERMTGEGYKDALHLLKPLHDAKKWKCLQPALKSAQARLGR